MKYLPKRLSCNPFRQRLFAWASGMLWAFTWVTSGHFVTAQEPVKAQATEPPAMIKITLPPETELRTLVDFVSLRLGVHILYDEQVANKKISINAPQPIPSDTLVDLLKSALRMKGLALIDADVKGWKRIVMADDLTRFAEPERKGQAVEDLPGTTAVTQTFSLTHMSPAKIKVIIDPFLSKQGANVITFPDKNLLIVTDYVSNLRRISQLIIAIDQAGPERTVRFYQVEFVGAEQLAQQLNQSVASRLAVQVEGISPVTITSDKRTNQLIVVGTAQQVEDVLRLAKAFDVTLEQRTQVYSFKFVNAERIDRLVKGMFDQAMLDRLYRSSIDQEDNLLIVTGTDEIHDRIEQFKKDMDLETKRPGSGVKFYRLTYASAEDVLNTLRSIDQRHDANAGNFQRGVSPLGRGGVGGSRSDGTTETPNDFVPGPNKPNQPGSPVNTPPALRQDGPNSPTDGNPAGMTNQGFGRNVTNGMNDLGASAIGGGRARISVDKNTNSIIVIGDRATQQTYEELIKKLDRRRPQVMIEAKVVVVDTSDNFSLGVELSGAGGTVRKLVQFTSFGLSTVSPTTGALAIIPGQGFNWTLVDPNGANAVVRALSSHSRAKVTSAPQLLVNDNATGNLASVTEVPFTSVNASNTVATTSFAGFAEAGTTIKVTPRITDDDHLELKYNVALNSFTGTGSNGVPPPRQTDEIQSTVVVPDGYTVIVGGLTRQNYNKSLTSVPIVETIPIINVLTGSRSKSRSQTTLFIFLRPVILRDDKFRDLKFLSDRAFPIVMEPGNYPQSAPLLIR